MEIEKEEEGTQKKTFPIVAIGASAGGLEAISELLKNLSPKTGMAYIYIQHLDPVHESSLPVLLQRVTQMKVIEVANKLPVEPDHVYVIPPNKEMDFKDDTLIISDRPPRPQKHYPIDQFFISLAKRDHHRSIGIILSGSASDGALGMKSINESGGFTFAQDETAKFQSMPKSAIAEDAVDAVLSPTEMARELERLSKNPGLLDTVLMHEPDEEKAAEEPAPEKARRSDISEVLAVLKAGIGVDFSNYKENTIRRRIMRRMLLNKFETLPEYCEFLRKNNDEKSSLYKNLLINVTSFFRDPDSIEHLKKEVLPGILKNITVNNPVRIWVPACSTGEEAYSLGMLIIEAMGDSMRIPVQIFATDLSQMAIAKARLGLYSESEVLPVSPKRLQRFFTKVDGHYRIIKSLRDLCIFAPHNIFKDPPFSKLDLISCCNLLIYLDGVLQRKILASFHYALNKGGFLVLGKSETVGSSAKLYTQLDKKVKIYLKKDDLESQVLSERSFHLPHIEAPQAKYIKKPVPPDATQNVNLDKLIDSIFLSRYAPAGVVITSEMDIVQFRGATGIFLEPSPGRASLNLLKMARSGLALDLRNAVQKVLKTGEPVKKTGVEIRYQGNLHQVAFEVMLLETYSSEKYLLIIFQELNVTTASDKKGSFSKDRRAKQLEAELIALREDMRSIMEEHEAANEELQSANEEIVSSNEELQSINEELETSKEEVECTNEELTTMNQELLVRNEQLDEAQAYSECISETIRDSVLVLDNTLRVKSANKAFYETFHTTIEETVGKLIYELAKGQWNTPGLKELLEVVIPRETQFYGYEMKYESRAMGEKILLLNVRKITQKSNQRQFILIAIEDITERRKAAMLEAEREAWLRNMANHVPVMIWSAGPDQNVTYLNSTWLSFTGKELHEEIGKGWIESVHQDDRVRVLSAFDSNFLEKTPFSIKFRMKSKYNVYRWILTTAVPTYNSEHEFTGYAGSCIEIFDEKLINAELDK